MVEVPPEQETPITITELDKSLELNIPQNVHDKLAEMGIRTLDNVRRNGGISNIKGLDLLEDDPLGQVIDEHAFLSIAVREVQDIQKKSSWESTTLS